MTLLFVGWHPDGAKAGKKTTSLLWEEGLSRQLRVLYCQTGATGRTVACHLGLGTACPRQACDFNRCNHQRLHVLQGSGHQSVTNVRCLFFLGKSVGKVGKLWVMSCY